MARTLLNAQEIEVAGGKNIVTLCKVGTILNTMPYMYFYQKKTVLRVIIGYHIVFIMPYVNRNDVMLHNIFLFFCLHK